MSVFIIIAILALIQSIFGIGILLFGTPIFLLLNYEFSEALLYLLPASSALSWSQVYDYRNVRLDGNDRSSFFKFILPSLLIGILTATLLNLKEIIQFIVIVMLLVSLTSRISEKFKERIERLIRHHLPFALGLMGLIHGLSNMGGSLLAPIVSSIYKQKEKMIAAISFHYAFMASSQLLFLLLIKREIIDLKYLLGIPIALLVRYSIGKTLLSLTKDRFYQKLINFFIFLNAMVLAIKLF
jgi:uncharacterized membrane protein YfcA